MPPHPTEDAVARDDLTRRVPGQALMAVCLAEQAIAAPRTRLERLVGARPLEPASRSWYLGAVGERITARLLESLGPEYVVLHSIPVAEAETGTGTGTGTASGTDVDHVVVGPMGVVTVTTKHHRDARVHVRGDDVIVAGRYQPYVHVARSERSRVERALAASTMPGAPVTSLVAVVQPAHVDVRGAAPDVPVVDARHLVRTVRRLPAVLRHDAVWALAGAVSSAETWSTTTPREPADVVSRFAALVREVRLARAARLAWAGAACAGVATGIVVAVAALPDLVGSLVGVQ